ncbi:MAG: response regulator [Spirochaetaceae bacterium]|nr:response regulator [Spirochaetaceae bacterium]
METKTYKFSVFLFTAILVISLIFGAYMLLRFRSLEKSIPVTSVSQYRHLASVLNLLTTLSTDIELTIVDNTPVRVEKTRFQLSKTFSFTNQIKESFNNQISEDLFPLLNELDTLLSVFKQLTDSNPEFDKTRAMLMHNRLKYLIIEFQDFVLRMNDNAIINLGKQVRNVEILQRSMIAAFLLVFISAAVMTYLVFVQRRMLSAIESAVEEASLANQAKSNFLANMSHEIRTPMNAIIGFTELLFMEEENPEKKDKLRMIKTSGNNLLLLINDILDFSKIEAGKIDIENKSFNLKTSLNYLHSMFQTKVEDRGLKFDIDIDKSVPELVNGDEHRIVQILTNIIGNALKFTKRGSITIKSNYLDGRVVIKIVDTGMGIPTNKLEHIFSAFGQAESSTDRKFGGTGLGLAISRQLAELMDGSLTAGSSPGKGSVFTLELPLSEVMDDPEVHKEIPLETKNLIDEEHEKPLTAVDTPYRILLAEDNKINQMLVKAILKSMDLKCDIAENGRIAIDKLAMDHYNLLLLDIQMPVMDGLETIKYIREDENLKDLYVIALTANAMVKDTDKYINAGCNDYLSKPIDRDLFLDKVNNLRFHEQKVR